MKFNNLKYLIFDSNGELIDPENKDVNSNTIFIKEMDSSFGFNSCLNIEYKKIPICLCDDSYIILPNIDARLKKINLGCGDISLHSIGINRNTYYGAIIYHDCFDAIGYHLFYEWYKFFLPEKEPHCCCKNHFNEILLPYANKVRKSMCKFFNLDDVYGKDIITKDLRISSYTSGDKL